MAFRLDMRLSERNILSWRFSEYGIHKKCLSCPLFDKCDAPQYDAPGLIRFFCRDYKEEKMNGKFNPGDHVYCVINSSITGVIIKRVCRDGLYLYSLKVDDEESFIKHFELGSYNVIFLHWQLKRA